MNNSWSSWGYKFSKLHTIYKVLSSFNTDISHDIEHIEDGIRVRLSRSKDYIKLNVYDYPSDKKLGCAILSTLLYYSDTVIISGLYYSDDDLSLMNEIYTINHDIDSISYNKKSTNSSNSSIMHRNYVDLNKYEKTIIRYPIQEEEYFQASLINWLVPEEDINYIMESSTEYLKGKDQFKGLWCKLYPTLEETNELEFTKILNIIERILSTLYINEV